MEKEKIKNFIERQITPVSIGVPKTRDIQSAEPKPLNNPDETEKKKPAAHIGRPKSCIEKVKLSVYVPADFKKRLIKIQHARYKQSLNDILSEAIEDLIKKYDG